MTPLCLESTKDYHQLQSEERKRDEALGDLEPFKIHDLRHSHVSTLIELGFTAFEISKRLGHSVEMVNNTYGHYFLANRRL